MILALSYVSDIGMHACCNNPLPTSHGMEDLCSKINLWGARPLCSTYLCSGELSTYDSNHSSNREAAAAIGQGRQVTPFQQTTG